MAKRIFVLCIVISAVLCAHADTTFVSGTVTGTWTRDHSPYVVTGDVFVDVDLTIEPGVRVLFEQGRRIMFFDNGFLDAVGAEGDSIIFTALSPDTDAWWGGLFFNNQVYSWMGYCVIEKVANPNHESDRGCGIRAHHTMMFSIEHSTLRHNSGGVGSAMYLEDGTHFITQCDLIDNGLALTGAGGAVWVGDSCALYVRNSRFIQNHALDAGAIDVEGGRAYVNNSEFIENQALIWGGALFSVPADMSHRVNLNWCVFRGNHSAIGGAMYSHAPLNVWYCLFDGNQATQQGGALCVTGSSGLVFNTWVNNQASSGGAVYGSGDSLSFILNSILAYNTGGAIRHLTVPVAFSDFYENSGGDTIVGLGNIFADPLFVDRLGGDYHLQWGSPCIDAGDSVWLDPDSTRADIGCYYYDQRASAFPRAPLPSSFSLLAYPNPFNPTVTLQLNIPQSGRVTVAIYDLLGRKVANLVNKILPSGTHLCRWEARDQSSGIYFAVFSQGKQTISQKLMLLK